MAEMQVEIDSETPVDVLLTDFLAKNGIEFNTPKTFDVVELHNYLDKLGYVLKTMQVQNKETGKTQIHFNLFKLEWVDTIAMNVKA